MALSRCDYCGKPFNSVGSKLCHDCATLMDDVYIKARKYIYKNSDKTDFISIVENAEVPEKALSYVINQGRLVIDGKSGHGPRCRACGAVTSGGLLCDACKGKLLSEGFMNEAAKADKASEHDKGKVVNLSYDSNRRDK